MDAPIIAQAPVETVEDRTAEPGIAIALSGGGYRAMLFHVGTLWRLFDLGLLQQAQRISSVSGGSITAGALALAWPKLKWNDGGQSFQREFVRPVRRLADHSIDIPSVLLGFISGGAAYWIERAYRRHVFGAATLQDLPDAPRFVINATSLHNGALWRFSKPYMGDWKSGRFARPKTPLARAVAASSAFPPFLSPVRLDVNPASWINDPGVPLPSASARLLTDGGVYDNLGLETVWKRYQTLFVSDGGGVLAVQPRPARLWALQAYRALTIIQDQVGALRVRQMLAGFAAGAPSELRRTGALIPISAPAGEQRFAATTPCPPDRAHELAQTKTTLRRMTPAYQERLINWGYAICDARVRSHYDPSLPEPAHFPYPTTGI